MGGNWSCSSLSWRRYGVGKKSERVAKTCASLIKLAPSVMTLCFNPSGESGRSQKKPGFFLIIK